MMRDNPAASSGMLPHLFTPLPLPPLPFTVLPPFLCSNPPTLSPSHTLLLHTRPPFAQLSSLPFFADRAQDLI